MAEAPALAAGPAAEAPLVPGQTSGVDQPMSSISLAALCSTRLTSPCDQRGSINIALECSHRRQCAFHLFLWCTHIPSLLCATTRSFVQNVPKMSLSGPSNGFVHIKQTLWNTVIGHSISACHQETSTPHSTVPQNACNQ